MSNPSLKRRMDEAELLRKQRDAEADMLRATNDAGRLCMEKVNTLRLLLADSFIGGEGEKAAFVPILTDMETKQVKSKLFELIAKL